jgi:hypothetical protein
MSCLLAITPLSNINSIENLLPLYNAPKRTVLEMASFPYANRILEIQLNVFYKIRVNLDLDEFASCGEADHLDG